MLNLKNVSLFLADGRIDKKSFESSLFAVRQCIEKVDFGEVIFQSAFDSNVTGVGYKKIKPMVIGEYSKLISGNLTEHIKTQFALVVQHDGFVLNANNWDNNFLNYDYIGAPWLTEATQRPDSRVGNGGFSLRSKKLLDVCTGINASGGDDRNRNTPRSADRSNSIDHFNDQVFDGKSRIIDLVIFKS